MNHAITIGGLLSGFSFAAGVLVALFGILSMFGNMMADAQGDNGKSGCVISVVGVALIVGGLIGLFA